MPTWKAIAGCNGATCTDDSSCTGTCVDDLECRSETFCEDGDCKPDRKPGQTCKRDAQCRSDFCVDGVCCDAACDRTCESCRVRYLQRTRELRRGDQR